MPHSEICRVSQYSHWAISIDVSIHCSSTPLRARDWRGSSAAEIRGKLLVEITCVANQDWTSLLSSPVSVRLCWWQHRLQSRRGAEKRQWYVDWALVCATWSIGGYWAARLLYRDRLRLATEAGMLPDVDAAWRKYSNMRGADFVNIHCELLV